jgi:hypothetical protein
MTSDIPNHSRNEQASKYRQRARQCRKNEDQLHGQEHKNVGELLRVSPLSSRDKMRESPSVILYPLPIHCNAQQREYPTCHRQMGKGIEVIVGAE